MWNVILLCTIRTSRPNDLCKLAWAKHGTLLPHDNWICTYSPACIMYEFQNACGYAECLHIRVEFGMLPDAVHGCAHLLSQKRPSSAVRLVQKSSLHTEPDWWDRMSKASTRSHVSTFFDTSQHVQKHRLLKLTERHEVMKHELENVIATNKGIPRAKSANQQRKLRPVPQSMHWRWLCTG